MRPAVQHHESDHRPPPRRRDYALFYFQQQAGRTYLRFTLLGVIAMVLLIVIPVSALFILFFINSRTPPTYTDVNINVAPATPSSANIPIIRLPPPPTPKPVRPLSVPPRPTPPPLNSNAAEPLSPKHTPQPTPSASPP